MFDYLKNWYLRHFTDPQTVILAIFLIVGFAVIVLAGDILAPLLASIVIAYLLDGAVELLRRCKVPRMVGTAVVFLGFVTLVILFIFGLIPLLSQQMTQFFFELPQMIGKGQQLLMQLPESYPTFISEQQVQQIIAAIRVELANLGHRAVSLSFASVVGLITMMIYVILVPLLIFFFLKDRDRILGWAMRFLPRDRSLANDVWRDVNQKIASYVRGKFVEILVVWFLTLAAFTYFGLNFAMLLSFLVGLSVIIPYVGAVVVTIPIMFVAYIQWGFTPEFGYTLLAYGIIQFLDGNLLVPVLFSEVVNLHPVAIITAVLVFGGIWGVWGVFFAIPLATLVQAVLKAWPKHREQVETATSETTAEV